MASLHIFSIVHEQGADKLTEEQTCTSLNRLEAAVAFSTRLLGGLERLKYSRVK